MCLSLSLIHTRFVPFRNKHSPKVDAIRSEVNMSPPAGEEEHYLTEKGFISCHLCLNAQTEQLHTEHDTSYNIIAVPNRLNTTSAN